VPPRALRGAIVALFGISQSATRIIESPTLISAWTIFPSVHPFASSPAGEQRPLVEVDGLVASGTVQYGVTGL